MISEYKAWYGKTEVFKEQLSSINCIRLYQTLNIKGNLPSFGETVFPMTLLILGEPSVSISPIDILKNNMQPGDKIKVSTRRGSLDIKIIANMLGI